MKTSAGSLALFLAAVFPASGPAKPQLEAQKVAEGVWAAQPDRGANVGWFLYGDGVVAVDSGADASVAREVLQEISETAGKPVRFLVVTHSHADHSGGARAFAAAGAQVVCHESILGPILAYLTQAVTDPADPFAGKPNARPTLLTVSDRLMLADGLRRAEIQWLGTAHTRGDLVVLLPKEKVLFSGDLALNRRIPYMQSSDVDPKGWEEALPRLAAVSLDRMVPGHGEIGPTTGIADTLAYVRRTSEVARKFLQGRVAEEQFHIKLREPENRIENVPVGEEHIANVKAVYRVEKEKLEKPTAGKPTPKKAS